MENAESAARLPPRFLILLGRAILCVDNCFYGAARGPGGIGTGYPSYDKMLGCLPVTSNARARQERAATRAQALVLRKVRQGQGERDFTSVNGRVRPLLVPLALV